VIESIACEQGVNDLYDYNATELVGKPLDTLIPSISNQNWQETITKLRFFGSQTKRGAQFPIIVRQHQNTVQITSMPVIAGLMTIKTNGIIEGCNDIFVKYLFGFSQQELVSRKNISQLLPQFPTLLANLKRDDLLQQGLIINNTICRKLLLEEQPASEKIMVNKRLLTHTPNNQPLPILVAVHRDGTPFEVQLQLKLVESSLDDYALWISFDREVAFKRFGHHHLISQSPLERANKKEPALTIMPPSPTETHIKQTQYRSPAVISAPHDDQSRAVTSTGTKVNTTSNYQPQEEIIYSAQSNATTIDDYLILDSLGQGAYGLVKLAIKKDDPTQVLPIIVYLYALERIYFFTILIIQKYL
jgi:hypothetical protein